MLDFFSSESKAILSKAAQQAEKRKSDVVESFDLIAAFMDDEDSAFAQVLRNLGLAKNFRWSKGLSTRFKAKRKTGSAAFSEEAKEILNYAIETSQGREHPLVLPSNLLLGIIKYWLGSEKSLLDLDEREKSQALNKMIFTYINSCRDISDLPNGPQGNLEMIKRLLSESNKLNTMILLQVAELDKTTK